MLHQAIMRQANDDLEKELAVVRAELARRDGQVVPHLLDHLVSMSVLFLFHVC